MQVTRKAGRGRNQQMPFVPLTTHNPEIRTAREAGPGRARKGKVVAVVHCWRLVTLRGDTTDGGSDEEGLDISHSRYEMYVWIYTYAHI